MNDDEKKREAESFDPYVPDFMTYETTAQKFLRVAKDAPYLVLAVGGGLGILAHGFYNFKNRGRPISQYIIHYRVYVQGYIVLTTVIGVGLHALKDYYQKNQKSLKLDKPKEDLKV